MKITPVFRVWVFTWPIDMSFNVVDLDYLNFLENPIFYGSGISETKPSFDGSNCLKYNIM